MSYVGSGYLDLVKTEPVGSTEPVSNLDDAIRQIKRYLVDTLGEPAVSGSIFDALTTAVAAEKVPLGSILAYAEKPDPWTAPMGYLKCDGNTIGDVSSGAFYESADYEDLFNFLKQGYGNVGDEIFAAGDTVKLPNFATTPFGHKVPVETDVTAVSGNGGSLSSETNSIQEQSGPNTLEITFGPIQLDSITSSAALRTLEFLTFEVTQYSGLGGRTFNSLAVECSYDSGITYEDVHASAKNIYYYGGFNPPNDYNNFYGRISVPTKNIPSQDLYLKFIGTFTAETPEPRFGLQATLKRISGVPTQQNVNFIIKAT